MLNACFRVAALLCSIWVASNAFPRTVQAVVDAAGPLKTARSRVAALAGRPLDSAVRKPIEPNRHVVPHGRLALESLVLMLQMDGVITARQLNTGALVWSADTGGSIISVDVVRPSRREAVRHDPFALPFIVEGGMLFTRRLYTSVVVGRQSSTGFDVDDAVGDDKADEYIGGDTPLDSSHPRFFMNLSTLIRRRHVHVGNTEIYATTSIKLIDFDSHTGIPITRPTPSMPPYLHVVLCNVTVHVERRGEYSWKLGIAQYKLSEDYPQWGSDGVTDERRERDLVAKVIEEHNRNNYRHSILSKRSAQRSAAGAVDIRRKTPEGGAFLMREVGRQRYVLWNTHTEAGEWANAVETEGTVVSTFLWHLGGGGLSRIPVYRLSTPASANIIARDSKSGGRRDNLPLLSDRPWSQNVVQIKPYASTWEDDIDADERETQELQDSMKQCSWLHECAVNSGQPMNYPFIGSTGADDLPQVLSISYILLNSITRRTLFFAFQTICILVSMTLVGFGMLLRPRLRNAWAQYDSLMVNMRNSSKSTPTNFAPIDRSLRGENSVNLSHVNADVGSSPLALTGTALPLGDEISLTSNTQGVGENDTLADISTGFGDTWWRSPNDYDDEEENGVADSSISRSDSASKVGGKQPSTTAMPQLFQQHFDVLKKVGHGGEGNVFCVKHQVTGSMYAIKAIRIREEDKQRCVREAILHSSLDNPNVVRYFYSWIENIPCNVAEAQGILHDESRENSLSYMDDSCTTRNPTEASAPDMALNVLFIQMEYFKSGTLSDHFRNRSGFTRLGNLEHLLQITRGLRYIHQQEVVHRDLKPTNIFVSDNGVMKIGDFGLAKRWQGQLGWKRSGVDELTSTTMLFDEERSCAAGTPLYWSPEQQSGGSATAASDVFSLGLIAVEFYCQFTTQHERLRTLGDARYSKLPPALVTDFPEEAKIFRKMLCERPETRVSVDEVIQSLKRVLIEVRESAEVTGKADTPSVANGESDFPSVPLESLSPNILNGHGAVPGSRLAKNMKRASSVESFFPGHA